MIDDEKLLTAEQQVKLSGARRAARLVGVILPLVLTVCGAVLQILWLPRMPDPAAVHWGIGGEPNGYGSPWFNVLTIGLTSLFLVVVFLFESFQARQGFSKPRAAVWGNMNRTIPAVVLGGVSLLQVSALMLTIPQLDAGSAQAVEPAPWALPTSFSIGIVVGLLAYLLQPRVRIERTGNDDTAPMPLEETERAFWFGAVRPAPVVVWGIVFSATFLTFGTAAVYASGLSLWWLMLIAVVVVVAAIIASCWFRIYISDAGLSVRSMLGWPRFYVPASDVANVTVTDINPVAEFGGWGLRWGSGKFGIIMRAGEAIVVTRKDGRTFTVTVDDAETGAAVLAAAAEAATKSPEEREKQ